MKPTASCRLEPLGEPPPPRNGLEKFCGPEVTRAETVLQFGAAFLAGLAAAAMPFYRGGLAWTWWQVLLAGLIALDMVGGVMTNATNSGKRWYHRSSQTRMKHWGFIVIHLAQIAVVYGGFAPALWRQGLVLYGVLLALAAIIIWTPADLQRPVALGGYAAGLLVVLYGLTPIPGMEWFAPVFLLKLLVSHLPVEIPFRLRRS